MRQNELPYLTADIPAIPMTFKSFYEDFVVEEVPAYEPSGEGDHLYLWIEKSGISTHEAIRRLAKALGVKPSDVGAAGLKDARALTRQYLSIEHLPEVKVKEETFQVSGMKILSLSRHRNKLKKGHLRGNRFILKLRGIDENRLADFDRVMRQMVSVGVPNYFGAQRFGIRGDTGLVGRAILEENYREAAEIIAGRPAPNESGPSLQAREAFMAGDYSKAASLWPRGHHEAERLCRVLGAGPGNYRRALFSLDKNMLLFYISAFQSEIFNMYLGMRIHSLDKVMQGDWASKRENGAMFRVDDLAAELPRAERFEISATGPLFGRKMREAEADCLKMEREVLRRFGVNRELFNLSGRLAVSGDRKPLRIPLEDYTFDQGEDDSGNYWQLSFRLLSGSYATSVLREAGKELLREGSSKTSS